jgi:oligoribonuclease NrnB/cAMP/cGMP phosphodiesterase (DHH superfamily)
MERIAVVFHKGCPDGYGALSAVVKKYGVKNLFYDEDRDLIYNYDDSFVAIPTNHSTDFTRLRELLERYKGDSFTLYMVDIFVEKIFEVAKEFSNLKRVVIIDHHKTAEEKIKEGVPEGLKDRFEIHFNMDRSAAALGWELLHGFVPEVMAYIEDRDIWKWEIPDANFVLTALDSEVFNRLKPNEIVERLLELVENFPKEELARKGASMIEFKESVVERLVNNSAHYIELPSGHRLLAVNSPVFQSEIGNRLAQISPDGVACVYSIAPKEEGVFVNCSLRSVVGKAREIAQANGGGGHDNAAGCRVLLEKVKFLPREKAEE